MIARNQPLKQLVGQDVHLAVHLEIVQEERHCQYTYNISNKEIRRDVLFSCVENMLHVLGIEVLG